MAVSPAAAVRRPGSPPTSSVSRTASLPSIGTSCRMRPPGRTRSAAFRCLATASRTDDACWSVLRSGRTNMQLAKPVIDVGLSTNDLEPMLRFWQQDAGLRFDHVLPVRRGQKQYRHDAQGSVIKLNHHAEPLPAAAPSGYRELIIAREGVQKPRLLVDPDGNRVRLVPPGHDGVTQLAIAMGVRSLSEHRRFYGDMLGFAEQPWSGGPAFRLGDSLLLLGEHRVTTVDPVRQARGWRYITLQVADIDAVHDDMRSKGVREGFAPITLGNVTRISMILDPDGNWIELSRRASIV